MMMQGSYNDSTAMLAVQASSAKMPGGGVVDLDGQAKDWGTTKNLHVVRVRMRVRECPN